MRIENEMLSRFNTIESMSLETVDMSLSDELDMFFNNVMDSVVDYFTEREEILVR